MAFPISPTNGQIYKNKMWNSASNAWVDSSAIVESGSNENGSYVKFSDGTMECRGQKAITGAYSGSSHLFSFPVEFLTGSTSANIDIQAILYNESGAGGNFTVVKSSITETSFVLQPWNPPGITTASWHAIGRWRA